MYISHRNLIRLLDSLKKDYAVYVPVKKGEQRFYAQYTGQTDNMVIGEVRAFEPLKAFFSRAREVVADGFKSDVPHAGDKPYAIVGVKACDLKGFKVQDHVFSAQGGSPPKADQPLADAPGGKNHDYSDPFYIKNREENLIISADCTYAIDTCFCLALGIQPYPTEDFDINLSSVDDGFIVEVGSKKGQQLIDQHSTFFQETSQGVEGIQKSRRKKVAQEVEKNIKENALPYQDAYEGIIERNYDSDIWPDEAKMCVECGACNTICPTCHCFLLYDQKDEEKMARLRMWDSCMIKDFARVAGGANPRPKLWMRLRNRFEKKFDFFPKIAGVYACTGCGRCISACPAKIDIRKVLKKLTSNA